MKKGLENFRDFGFIFPSFLPVSSTSHSSHLLPHLLTRINSRWVSSSNTLIIPLRLFFVTLFP